MTTAHRPTWTPAQGGRGKYDTSLGHISQQTSVRDAPAHTKLKFRDDVESKDAEDLKRELNERENQHFADKRKEQEKREGITAITGELEGREQRALTAGKKSALLAITTDEADEDLPEEDGSDSDTDSDSDDDDDDDTAQLLAELEKIKKERAEERARKEARKEEEDSRVRLASIVKGNPLLNDGQSGDFTVKRRWDEDTVFKNCARGEEESKKKPKYINDTLRSEAHLKFMQRFIK